MRNVTQNILQRTRENPIDYEQSISAGAQEDLSMQVIRESQIDMESERSKMIRDIVQRLMEIADDPASPLETKTRNGDEYVVLEYGQVISTVLYSDEILELRPSGERGKTPNIE